MPTHRVIAETETDPMAPIVAALMKALAANLPATAEGATGAPRVQGRALGGLSLGAGNINGTTPLTFIDCDRMGVITIKMIGTLTSAQFLQADYSNDNGATWTGFVNMVQAPTVGSVPALWGQARINLQTGAWYAALLSGHTATSFTSGTGTHTVPANCNAFRLRWASGGPTVSADVYCLGGLA